MNKPDIDLKKVADSFCIIVAEWGFKYHPERMPYLYSGKLYSFPAEITPNGAIARDARQYEVHPDDVCDANMAMLAAFEEHGVDYDKLPRDADEAVPLWFNQMFDEAYTIASRCGWRPIAQIDVNDQTPRYMAVWTHGYREQGAELHVLGHFTPELGYYDIDDFDQVASLKAEDVLDLSGVTDNHYVVRIW